MPPTVLLIASISQAAADVGAAGGFDWWLLLWIPLGIIGGLLLLALILAGTVLLLVGAGASAGAKGLIGGLQSLGIRKKARKRLDEASQKHELAHAEAQERVDEFNLEKIRIVTATIGGFADWMQRNRLNVNLLAHEPADIELINAIQVLPDSKMTVDEISEVVLKAGSGTASAVIVAAGANAAVMATASAIGTASTGAAISSLSGAAAQNASLAWLGGGAVAAGGGGMAVGGVVLMVITAAPAVAIGGFTLGILGTKARTRSRQYAAEVDVACAQIETIIKLREACTRRIDELSMVMRSLAERLHAATKRLDALDFDPGLHADQFRQALLLVRSIREVTTIQVLDPVTGELTEMSTQLISRYR